MSSVWKTKGRRYRNGKYCVWGHAWYSGRPRFRAWFLCLSPLRPVSEKYWDFKLQISFRLHICKVRIGRPSWWGYCEGGERGSLSKQLDNTQHVELSASPCFQTFPGADLNIFLWFSQQLCHFWLVFCGWAASRWQAVPQAGHNKVAIDLPPQGCLCRFC